jgi:glycosyltransferase involved in cell wall biosynthesis
MKKIKLLLVSSVFVDRGVERILTFLYKSLPKDLYEVRIVCLRNLAPFADYLNKNSDIRVDVIGMKSNYDIFALFRLYSYFKDFKPDIINIHSFRAALWGRLLAKLAGVPVVLYSVHNKWGGVLHHLLDRGLARFTDAIVPFSIAVRDFLLHEEKIPAKYIGKPIYIGIDIKKFSEINQGEVNILRTELGIREGQNVIGFVGSIAEQKGLIYLVESVKKLAATFSDLRCLIIGEGPEEEPLKKIIRKYNLEDHFTFLGQRYDIYNLLHVMKIFVLPSLWEGLPQVVIEAMAASCPVIATDVDGTPEIITHKKDGWLVPSADVGELSKAIELLLSDEGLRKELAENGFKTVKNRFSVEAMTENYNNLYQSYFKRL